MIEALLTPLIAFGIYFALAAALSWIGRQLAGKPASSPLQTSTYAGGEAAPSDGALPGYASTFVIALFFAILHVGVLMLGTGGHSTAALLYLAGLALTLVALISG